MLRDIYNHTCACKSIKKQFIVNSSKCPGFIDTLVKVNVTCHPMHSNHDIKVNMEKYSF